MKISELVEILEEYKDKLGDVEVYTLNCDYESPIHELKESWYAGVFVVIE